MTRAHSPRFGRRQGGFSLIDVLLALGVTILISGIVLTSVRRNNESNQAKAVGEQMKLVGSALNTYVSLRYDTLVAAVPGSGDVGDPGTAADPGPRTCVASSATLKICTITSETLRRNGLLPNSFSGFNAFGSPYEYRIRVDTAGAGTPLVDGMVWTQDAYTLEGEARYDLIGQAMMVAGADSGMTRSLATRIEGFNGAWAEDSIGVNTLGVLAYRVGYNTFGYAAYLRLSGGTMLGDMDMGGQTIFNAQALKSTTAATNNLYVKQVNGAITFTDGFDPTTGDAVTPLASDPNIGATGTSLVMRSDTPIQIIEATDGSVRGDLVMDDLEADAVTTTGNITSGGTITNVGGISSQGTISTTGRMQADSILAGPGGAANNVLAFGDASGGGIYFNTDSTGVSGTPRGFKLDNSTQTITLYNATLGATDIAATGRISAGGVNTLALDGSIFPTIGASCTATQVGTIARGATGDLVQCANNNGVPIWKTMGLVGTNIQQVAGAQACTGAGAASGTPVTISCPAGWNAISGGYQFSGTSGTNAPRGAPQNSYRLNDTQWVVQAGPTQAYTGSETVGTCWNTYVICTR